MADQDNIDKFIALPREQQLTVLGRLSPDMQTQLLAEVKTRRSKPNVTNPQAPQAGVSAITPKDRTIGAYLGEGLTGVGRGIENAVSGTWQTLRHPKETGAGLLTEAIGSGLATQREFEETKGAPMTERAAGAILTGLENAPFVGPMVQHAEGGGGRMGSPEALGAAVEGATTLEAPHMIEAVPGMVRKGVETVSGTGPKAVRGLVKETVAENEGIATKNQKSAEEHQGQTQEALHEQKGRELTYTQQLKENLEKIRKERAEKLAKHREEVAEQQKKVQEQAKAQAEKEASAKATEAQRGTLQTDLKDASEELRGRVETARENALKEGNEKYSAVNAELNELPADMETVQDAAIDATGKIKGTQKEPTVLKGINHRIQEGEPLDYEDLQGYYSELGKELSKGTLIGDEYTALDTLHEAIGDEMQRIADSQGLGEQLSAARNYWRRMKQTFGKPLGMRDAANKTIQALSPEWAKSDVLANRVRLLASFDPEIEAVANRVAETRGKLKALPKTSSALSKSAEVPTPATPPAFEGTPEQEAFRETKQPERPEFPTRPVETPPKKIGAKEVKEAKGEALEKRTESIERHGGWIAAWPLFYVIRDLSRGAPVSLGGAAMESAGTLAAVSTVSRILRNPRVVNFLTTATERDIAQIPPDLRGDFPQIVSNAQKLGIKVSKALARLGQGAAVAGPMTRQLKEQRDQQRTSAQQ